MGSGLCCLTTINKDGFRRLSSNGILFSRSHNFISPTLDADVGAWEINNYNIIKQQCKTDE